MRRQVWGYFMEPSFWTTYVSVWVKFIAKAQRKKLKLVHLLFLPKYNSISAQISHSCFICVLMAGGFAPIPERKLLSAILHQTKAYPIKIKTPKNRLSVLGYFLFNNGIKLRRESKLAQVQRSYILFLLRFCACWLNCWIRRWSSPVCLWCCIIWRISAVV